MNDNPKDVTLRLLKPPLRIKADHARHKRCQTLIAVLEDPSNVENVGAVIRNIDCLGISKLYIVSTKFTEFAKPGRHNVHSTNLMRTSVSAIRWVYVHPFETTSMCFDYLQANDFVSLVTSPHIQGHENNLALLDSNFTTYKKLAIWFGNEARGISQEAITRAKGCIQIEMCGIVESLNLSVCTGIVLHFIASQRRKYTTALKRKKKEKLLAGSI